MRRSESDWTEVHKNFLTTGKLPKGLKPNSYLSAKSRLGLKGPPKTSGGGGFSTYSREASQPGFTVTAAGGVSVSCATLDQAVALVKALK